MVFDNPLIAKEPASDVNKNPEFVETIKRLTHNSSPLKVIASDIDNALRKHYAEGVKTNRNWTHLREV